MIHQKAKRMQNLLLEQATTATKQENWSLANQYLEKLLLERSHNCQKTLDIALTVLEYGDFQERWDVAKLFPKLGEKAIIPLIDILKDEEAELDQRWFAGRILGEFNHPDVITSLVNLLQTTEDEELATLAINSLGNLGEVSLDILSQLLTQPESVRLATLALAQIRRPEIITPLLTVVNHEDATVRITAIEALSSFHDPRIPPVLINALNDLSAKVRKEAVIGLGVRTDLASQIDLLTHLQPLLYDFNLEVSTQAVLALSRLRTPEVVQALFQVLEAKTTPIPLQITLIQALAWIETPTSLTALEKALEWVSTECIMEIIRVLGRIKSNLLKSQAAEILLNFFHTPKEKTPILKQTLAYAWGQLASDSVLKVLQQLKEDEDNGVKLHAVAALKRLTINNDQ